VTNTNPSIVEGTVDVAVPYRWVNAVGDIVILSHFPERVATIKKEEKTKDESSEIDVVK
jgi:sporulation protein YlmC with PRC-barrel domain